MDYVRIRHAGETCYCAHPPTQRIAVVRAICTGETDLLPCVALEYQPVIMARLWRTLARIANDEISSRCTVRTHLTNYGKSHVRVEFRQDYPSPDAIREAASSFGTRAPDDAARSRLALCAMSEVPREEYDALLAGFYERGVVAVLAYAQSANDIEPIQFLTNDVQSEHS